MMEMVRLEYSFLNGINIEASGGFNKIISSFEKKGGLLRLERQMEEFRTTLEDYGLNDLGYTGRWFTWERGRFLSTNIRERLDRGVGHLSHAFSDHCPILLDTIGKQRIEQCLENSFEEVVKRKWDLLSGSVPNKLEILGQQLYQWDQARNREKKKVGLV
ncbi:hypothetical protein PVK06_005944 [Gossypium arboreum]|uniref:Reverse transcriptase n=1 Tax=Gossypium arboreum TaxID=29729 RepID=A0ABR0QX78_GOSAR|nr:hypothetical protein PVK06_005944 [Gossypium arboreum]